MGPSIHFILLKPPKDTAAELFAESIPVPYILSLLPHIGLSPELLRVAFDCFQPDHVEPFDPHSFLLHQFLMFPVCLFLGVFPFVSAPFFHFLLDLLLPQGVEVSCVFVGSMLISKPFHFLLLVLLQLIQSFVERSLLFLRIEEDSVPVGDFEGYVLFYLL